MSNETTRRRSERRRNGGHVAEVELERPDVTQSVDEDAAAFLQEAAEAAAAAELAGPDAESDAQTAADAAVLEAEALAAEMEADAAARVAIEAEVAAEELAAADLDAAAEAIEELAAAPGEVAVDAPVPEVEFDEAELAAIEAELARDAAANGDEPLLASTPADEMARELSESATTVDEELVAQAEEEKDPDGDVLPTDIAETEDELQGSFEKMVAKAKRLSEDQVRHVVHSILFVADRPLAVDQIRAATGIEPARIRASLERLAGDLREGISGVVLSEVGGGWQMRTAPESAEFVRRFLQVKPRRLTRAALETLAIIAYRQPVTRPEIEDIRGVDCGAVVKALLDWKLIKILGKKDEVGRPLLYGTSREFLEFFQLKDLASLPTLREFHELNEESRQIVEEELGPEAAADIAGTVNDLGDPAYLEAERERIAKSEAALAELEQALADAEQKATTVANTINPPKDPEAAPAEAPSEES